METFGYLLIAGVGLFSLGAIIGFGVILKYSNFLVRMKHEGIPVPSELTLEYVDGWSRKNFQLMMFFWNRKHIAFESAELIRIGDQIRRLMRLSTTLCVAALVVLSVYDCTRK